MPVMEEPLSIQPPSPTNSCASLGRASPPGGAACESQADEGAAQTGGGDSVSSPYEQSAVAALLGMVHARSDGSSPEDDQDDEGNTFKLANADHERWGGRANMRGYDSPSFHSPKVFDYESPGYPSPKRARFPKDGAPAPPLGPSLADGPPPVPARPQPQACEGAAPAAPRRPRPPPPAAAGAPPPGTCRFRCRYPGCTKLYASTDAVRKHCRKRHLEWLRRIDQVSAHDRGMPKPALYCIWGDDDYDI